MEDVVVCGPSSPTPLGGEGDELKMELLSFLSSSSTSSSASTSSSSSASSASCSPLRQSRSALHLLRNLPPAREAILQFYSRIFEDSLIGYLKEEEEPNDEYITIRQDFSSLVMKFLSENSEDSESCPETWAPFISDWSLNLLGKLSVKHWSSLNQDRDINHILSTRLSCPPVKTLMDLTFQCFKSLMSSSRRKTDASSTVSSLIDTSLRYGPHFDWVVAHIGGCFPQTVIDKVLYVGLKNFYSYTSQNEENVFHSSSPRISRLTSVVGIVDHLASTHQSVLKDSLRHMTSEAFENVKFNKSNSIELATIPYLLFLSRRSPILSSAITRDIVLHFLVKPDIIEKIAKCVPKWNKTYFNTEEGSLVQYVQDLIINNSHNGAELLGITFEILNVENHQGIKILIESLINELTSLIHHNECGNSSGGGGGSSGNIPLLISVGENLQLFLDKFILSDNVFVQNSVISIITFTALKIGKGVSIRTIKHCLTHASNDIQLGVALRYIREIEMWQTGVVYVALEQSLMKSKKNPSLLLENIARLLEYEKQTTRDVITLTHFGSLIPNFHGNLLIYLSQRELVPKILRIMELAPIHVETRMTVSLMHRMIQCCVHTMFAVLSQRYDDPRDKLNLVFKIEGLLSRLSNHHLGLPMVLRFLMEGALKSSYANCLGGIIESDLAPPAAKRNIRLMDQNMKFGSMPTHPVGATTVYHAGIIGNGAKYLNQKMNTANNNNFSTEIEGIQ